MTEINLLTAANRVEKCSQANTLVVLTFSWHIQQCRLCVCECEDIIIVPQKDLAIGNASMVMLNAQKLKRSSSKD